MVHIQFADNITLVLVKGSIYTVCSRDCVWCIFNLPAINQLFLGKGLNMQSVLEIVHGVYSICRQSTTYSCESV